MLNIESGGKSFGVLGQGNAQSSWLFDSALKYSTIIPKEEDVCEPSYLAVTLLPKTARDAAKNFKMTFSSVAWRTDVDFTNPVTPTAPYEALKYVE